MPRSQLNWDELMSCCVTLVGLVWSGGCRVAERSPRPSRSKKAVVCLTGFPSGSY